MDEPLLTLITMLAGFKHDPADTDYQKGYEAALREFASTGFNLTQDQVNQLVDRRFNRN